MNEGEQEGEFLFKIVLIGNSNVGKTNIISRYCNNTFSDQIKNTIGVDFQLYETKVDDQKVLVQFWDTAGQEKFRSMSGTFYKYSHAAILVYDVTDLKSFEDLEDWLQEVRSQCRQDIKLMLFGNKKDLQLKRKVTLQQGDEFAKLHSMFFMETSAKENNDQSINQGMVALFSKVLKEEISKGKDSQIFPLMKKKDLVDLMEDDDEINTKNNCC